jgi:RNA polymerase sigma-70 factor (ECF subfamily)
MVEERTDEQLMERVRAGDVDAFGRLVERHHQRALNFAFRMTGDREMSRDIAQESFLRIMKAAPRYEPRARFTTFLYTVVRNLVAETVRRPHHRSEVSSDDISHGASNESAFSPSPETPDVSLERTELRERLLRALESLPKDLREAFVLTEIEGLRYREAADICGCPEGTVASRKHHAVEHLREILEPFRQGDATE